MKKWSTLGLLVLALNVIACGETDPANEATIGAEPKLSGGPMETESQAAIRGAGINESAGTLQLADDSFDLDTIICFGTSTATAIASDSRQRSDYPVVTLKTYDAAASGGYSINTASALFERDGYGEHWKLHEGTVEKEGKIFTASGMLEGSRLMPKPDGTRKSAAIEGKNVLPFEIRIEC